MKPFTGPLDGADFELIRTRMCEDATAQELATMIAHLAAALAATLAEMET